MAGIEQTDKVTAPAHNTEATAFQIQVAEIMTSPKAAADASSIKAGSQQASAPESALLPAITLADNSKQSSASQAASDAITAAKIYQLGDGMGKSSPDPAISAFQTELKNLNYPVGTIDGRFGAGTQEAVKEFQTANGLPSNGIVDAETLAKMGDAKAVPGKGPAPVPPEGGGPGWPKQWDGSFGYYLHDPGETKTQYDARVQRSWDTLYKTGRVTDGK